MTPEDYLKGVPPGYGAQVTTTSTGEMSWRNLICHKCGALVPDDPPSMQAHDTFHKTYEDALATFLMSED